MCSVGMASWQKAQLVLARGRLTCALSHPFSIPQTGKRVGKVLHSSLQTVLHKEESLGPKRQKVGFLG